MEKNSLLTAVVNFRREEIGVEGILPVLDVLLLSSNYYVATSIERSECVFIVRDANIMELLDNCGS